MAALGRRCSRVLPLPGGCSTGPRGRRSGATAVSLAAPLVRLGRGRAPGSPEQRRVLGAQVHAACRDVGFFQVTGHGVEPELRAAVLASAARFFELGAGAKDAVSIRRSRSWRGYQRVGENITQEAPDWHEALDLYSESAQAANSAHEGANQWPREVPTLRPAVERYVAEMRQLGADLMRLIALGLQLPEDHFDRDFDDSFWCLRAIRYPPSGGERTAQALGVGEHTDYGCLTLLMADDQLEGGVGALQVRDRRGEWVHLEAEPGAIMCNIGDMLARWTNGIYRSTPHRVLRPRTERIAVPFFFEPNYSAVVEPIPYCCRLSGLPSCYPPVKYGDHLLSKTSANFAPAPPGPAPAA
uniref:Fe2OG dioxygenase domain-containing protein n=1 Tax=Alexandrium monilatum TaxID=311494 RepID=A0A7S4S1K1_9DINO